MGETAKTSNARSAADRTDGRALLLGAAALAATGAIYLNSIHAPFVFDDYSAILDDPGTPHPWSAALLLRSRPLTRLSYGLNYALGGTDPTGYHALNLLLHLINGCLFLQLGRAVLKRGLPKSRRPHHFLVAVACMAIFLVHPLQTGTVTYLAGRSELLCSCFYLAALLCFGKAVQSRSTRTRSMYIATTWSAALLAVASKEIAVTLPLALLAYDFLLLQSPAARSGQGAWTSSRNPSERRWRIVAYSPFLLVPLPIVWWIARNPAASLSAGFGYAAATPTQYLATQFGVLLHYLRLAVWPAGLCLDYAWPFAPTLFAAEPLLRLVMLVLVGGALVLTARRSAAAWLLLIWTLLVLGPTSSLMPLADAAVEHRMYLPLGWLAMLAALALGCGADVIERRLQTAATRGGLAVAAAAAILALAAATVDRNRTWQDPVALWQDTIRKAPHNARAYYNLGHELRRAGRDRLAEAAFDVAVMAGSVGMRTVALPAVYNRARLAASDGRLQAAVRDVRTTLSAEPSYAPLWRLLGVLEARRGRLAAAIAATERAVHLAPGRSWAHCNLASLLAADGDRNAAQREVATCFRQRVPTVALRRAADLAIDVGRYEEARPLLQHLAERLASDPRARYELRRASSDPALCSAKINVFVRYARARPHDAEGALLHAQALALCRP